MIDVRCLGLFTVDNYINCDHKNKFRSNYSIVLRCLDVAVITCNIMLTVNRPKHRSSITLPSFKDVLTPHEQTAAINCASKIIYKRNV